MYKQILFPVDLAEPASWRHALPIAIELCQASGAALHVLTVTPEFSPKVSLYFPPDMRAKSRAATVAALQEFVAKNVPTGVAVEQQVAEGTIYREIIARAEAIGADLVVMASHRPDAVRDFMLGANAAQVVRHCPASVLVVRSPKGH